MKTVLDKVTRDELTARISSLSENSAALWGKMNVYQMTKHCTLWEEMTQTNKKQKRAFVGLIFGKMALRKVLKDDAPLAHSTPTLPELRITGDGDVAAEKAKWIILIGGYEHFATTDYEHPFFGKMTREQVGQLAYKHTDHHLRQFGC